MQLAEREGVAAFGFAFDLWSGAEPARLQKLFTQFADGEALFAALSGVSGGAAAWRNAALLAALRLDLPPPNDTNADTADGAARRLAMLDKARLRQLAGRIGLVLAAPRLRRVIGRQQIEALGAALSCPHWQESVASAPALPAASAFFADLPDAALAEAIIAAGSAALEIYSAELPPPLAARLFLKLPPLAEAGPDDAAAQAEPATRQAAAALARDELLSLLKTMFAESETA